LLLNIPQLSWVTINIEGCKANIIVSERIAPPKIKSNEPCDIIAKKTGQIINIECYNGTPIIKIGNTVSKGETIISNVMPLKSGGIINVHSDAKVIAQTQFDKTVEFDLIKHNKKYTGEKKMRRYLDIFSIKVPLFLAKKVDGDFDISEEKTNLTFFGSKLPFAITSKTYNFYKIKDDKILQDEVKKILLDILSQYETTELIDACIIKKNDNYEISNERITLTRSYVAEENIAKQVPVK
ncbi:MAG: sporulation protein YqfD, partial [Oscillospiraceae bacterium]